MNNTFKQHLTDIIYKNKEGFTYTLQISKNLFIGGWLSDDNTYFLDLSLRFENRKDALIMGKLQKQQSIFNIKNKNCISCE